MWQWADQHRMVQVVWSALISIGLDMLGSGPQGGLEPAGLLGQYYRS